MSMLSRILPLAIAGGASLTAFAGAVHSQDQYQSPILTLTCEYRDGPRAGLTVDYTTDPGAVAVPIGSRCADMQGSSGVAVSQAPGRQQTHRLYMSPGAPNAWGSPGQLRIGYSLTCRFDYGPRAGTSQDYSGVLGAEPVVVDTPCSDGASRGVAISSWLSAPE